MLDTTVSQGVKNSSQWHAIDDFASTSNVFRCKSSRKVIILFWKVVDSFRDFCFRILNRFSADMTSIDIAIPRSLLQVTTYFAVLLLRSGVQIYAAPWFAVAVVIGYLLYLLLQVKTSSFLLKHLFSLVFLQRFYARSCSQFQRLEVISRSPILSLAHETMQGTDVVRTFRKSSDFIKRFETLINSNACAKLTMMASIR